jgi:hypothetical protein
MYISGRARACSSWSSFLYCSSTVFFFEDFLGAGSASFPSSSNSSSSSFFSAFFEAFLGLGLAFDFLEVVALVGLTTTSFVFFATFLFYKN